MSSIGVAIIGTGQIALANHLKGIALSSQARVVALCDTNETALRRAGEQTGITLLFDDYQKAITHPDVQAVIVATPNFTHAEIASAAIAAGRHVLCEKPLALDYPTADRLHRQAEEAGVRHMTAFTYRFVPAMRYMKQLIERGDIGQPLHFRAQRFQDWADRPLGWRQIKRLAGTGELGDMLSHRIDYGHLLIGPIRRLVADLRTYVDSRGATPSDVDDWVAMLCEFEGNVSGVLESTKLATGRGEGYGGEDTVEVNGTAGSIVYSTQKPLELRVGRRDDPGLTTIPVPKELLVWPGSPRNPAGDDPRIGFRYDQSFEFIDAIVNNRPCQPGFGEGAAVQRVMDMIEQSARERAWIEL